MQQNMQTTQLHMEITTLEQLADVLACLREDLQQCEVHTHK